MRTKVESIEEIAERIADDAYRVNSNKYTVKRAIVEALRNEREACAIEALEQRCERGTPWDAACVAIAKAIRTGDVRRQ